MISKHPLTTLATKVGHIDNFLCFASYENRCRSVADSLNISAIGRSAIGLNINRNQFNGTNREYLSRRLGESTPIIEFNVSMPTIGADNVAHYLEEVFSGSSKSLLVDITTFTHEGLLILIKLLSLKKREMDTVRLVYVGAEEYSIGLDDEDKWLSKGTREIRSVLGYPGLIFPSKRLHLIVLVGFETERARSLIDAYEPHLLSLGVGTSLNSITQKNFKANDLFFQRIARTYQNCGIFEIAPNDYQTTLSALRNQANKNTEYNVVIAPMNTKISTIAAGLLAMENESLQLCYAQAELYNYENYSSASNDCFLIEL
jgi:hypothetical protein